MSFKKKNISLKKNNNVLNIIGILAIGIIFIVAIFIVKEINFFKITIDDKNVLGLIQEEEKDKSFLETIFGSRTETKPEKEEISILIAGRGGALNDAPDLTDTIILLKANTFTKTVSMLSIPRDLYVKYPGNTTFEGKINGVYATNSRNSVDFGMTMLAEKITEITGQKIDYYVNVDFKGFIEMIDTINGITIEVPENFVDYEYPDDNWGYTTLMFRKGIWLFDGENALKYVRSRHSTSDFDRSLRQQQVISAIKDKILSTYLITSPLKIKELYDVFSKNVFTNISVAKMLDLAYSFRDIKDFSIISSNMNDSCFYGSSTCAKGGILYVPLRELYNGASVLLFYGSEKGDISNYELPKKYSHIIFNYPLVGKESLKINILNSLKINNLASALSNDIIRYGFNITSLGNTDTELEKTVIYYNNINKESETLQALKLFFDGEIIETEGPVYSKNWANIEIVIGRDYLNSNNIFKF